MVVIIHLYEGLLDKVVLRYLLSVFQKMGCILWFGRSMWRIIIMSLVG